MADHGANGPEVVVAVEGSTIEEMAPSGIRSRCWCCMEATRDVAAWSGYTGQVAYARPIPWKSSPPVAPLKPHGVCRL